MTARLFRTLWGIYALLVFLVVALGATALMILVPGLERRRRLARGASRLVFRAWGVPLTVDGLEHLPPDACVVVANHASYLDGIILTAALPARFCFVIKQEMRNVPAAGYLLRRIGSEFVERNNRHRGAVDARRLLRKAHGGDALAFFPEGTFRREPGLGPFRSGAFVAAARAGLAVVPIVIRGARYILPESAWLPRPGRLEVRVTPALGPAASTGNDAARKLILGSRRRMLEIMDEPDLGPPTPAERMAAESAGEGLTP